MKPFSISKKVHSTDFISSNFYLSEKRWVHVSAHCLSLADEAIACISAFIILLAYVALVANTVSTADEVRNR